MNLKTDDGISFTRDVRHFFQKKEFRAYAIDSA